mmetsp:Transcript_8218/g.30313  ORF Transcript_8218/g.30313 Transcript_8218/m.30313 type:complete len:579 (-) Transcript_8218:237-1973(-)|eukprot:scaffold109_cov389-Prasinococcus_capsulatus_cf.AAC.7
MLGCAMQPAGKVLGSPGTYTSGPCRNQGTGAWPSVGVRRLPIVARRRAQIQLDPGSIKVGRLLGQGAFGKVYEGKMYNPLAGVEEDIILKRPQRFVEDAAELAEAEAHMNLRVQREIPGVMTGYVGVLRVSEKGSGIGLQSGHWLVWQKEGSVTLSKALKERNFPSRETAQMILGVDRANQFRRGSVELKVAVTQTIVKQMLQSLGELHRIGIVHRDIKPANMVFCTSTPDLYGKCPLKLIDLGACADLRKGVNYDPQVAILDPIYCPPERYVLPRNMWKHQHLLSPLVWAGHNPDRYDMFSIGLILMQMTLPMLRNPQDVYRFKMELEDCGYDLDYWRENFVPGRDQRQFAALDACEGEAWDLARQLLRERDVSSPLRFQNRPSCQEALSHPFMKRNLARYFSVYPVGQSRFSRLREIILPNQRTPPPVQKVRPPPRGIDLGDLGVPDIDVGEVLRDRIYQPALSFAEDLIARGILQPQMSSSADGVFSMDFLERFYKSHQAALELGFGITGGTRTEIMNPRQVQSFLRNFQYLEQFRQIAPLSFFFENEEEDRVQRATFWEVGHKDAKRAFDPFSL